MVVLGTFSGYLGVASDKGKRGKNGMFFGGGGTGGGTNWGDKLEKVGGQKWGNEGVKS